MQVHSDNLRYIVDRFLRRLSEAGLLAHVNAITEFLFGLLEARHARAAGSGHPPALSSQWLDFQWLWTVYATGNAMAATAFGVGVLWRWWAPRTNGRLD